MEKLITKVARRKGENLFSEGLYHGICREKSPYHWGKIQNGGFQGFKSFLFNFSINLYKLIKIFSHVKNHNFILIEKLKLLKI